MYSVLRNAITGCTFSTLLLRPPATATYTGCLPTEAVRQGGNDAAENKSKTICEGGRRRRRGLLAFRRRDRIARVTPGPADGASQRRHHRRRWTGGGNLRNVARLQ